MRISKPRTGVLVLAGLVGLLVAGGIAYATIPDGGGVFTACRLNGVGTIRLIDPSGPSGSLLSRCTQLETQIQWNAKGQTGATGPAGPAGASPTVAQLAAGDAHCPSGGAAITDAKGSTAYVCSGASFDGTFTSPNGQFSLSVADDGVHVTGPNASITISSTGALGITAADETVSIAHDRVATVGHDETVHVAHDRTQTVDNNETITIHGNRTETVDQDQSTTIGGNRTESVSMNETITIGKSDMLRVGANRSETIGTNDQLTVDGGRTETVNNAIDLRGSLVTINGGSQCLPVARESDLVATAGGTGTIITGSATVCVG